jgi:hypothetical protein
MRLERIEELLRLQPPDEPRYPGQLLSGPRMVRASQAEIRGRRPFAAALNAATVIMVLLGVVVLVLVLGPLAAAPKVTPSTSTTASESPQASPALGVIPWLDATPMPSPPPEPTPDARTLPACTSDDVVLAASGWDGATGSLAGGASVVNLSSSSCTVGGKPGIELLDGRGTVIARGPTAKSAPGGQLVVLQPGGVASVGTVWMNWCGTPPMTPLSVRLFLPGSAGELVATIRGAVPATPNEVPRCDSRGTGSTIGVSPAFATPEPSEGGDQAQDCAADKLAAYLGDWVPAAGTSYANLVVLNVDGVECRLGTSPTLELRDAAGRHLVVARSEPPAASASTVLLPPGWAAIVPIGFSNWCSPPPATPLRADLLVGSARLAIEARSPIPVPPCMSAPQTPPPSLFYDGMFAIPGSPAPEPDPVDSVPVSVTLSALPASSPGGTLQYTVTLTNVSPYNKPLNLAALCPAYTVRLFLPNNPNAIETHFALNCEPVGVLGANLPVTFAMRLPIPTEAPTGTATLVWQLDTRGAAAKATFTIGS